MSWIWKTPISKFHDSFEECSRPCLGQSTRWVETNPLVFWCWIIHVHQLRISLLAGYLRLALLCRPLFWLRTGWWIVIFPNTLLGMIMYDTLSSTNRGFEHCHTSTCLFRKSGFFHVGLQTHNIPIVSFDWVFSSGCSSIFLICLANGQGMCWQIPTVSSRIPGFHAVLNHLHYIFWITLW